jgi:hypothetical protein
MARNYLDSDLKRLWGYAAQCFFPGCGKLLIEQATDSDPAAVLGEICHIESSSPDGPIRVTATPIGDGDRDRYDNLILLCPTHHALIDKQPNTYTADELRRWKRDHEAWVRSSLESEMTNVGFAELEMLTSGIVNTQVAEPGDMTRVLRHPEVGAPPPDRRPTRGEPAGVQVLRPSACAAESNGIGVPDGSITRHRKRRPNSVLSNQRREVPPIRLPVERVPAPSGPCTGAHSSEPRPVDRSCAESETSGSAAP